MVQFLFQPQTSQLTVLQTFGTECDWCSADHSRHSLKNVSAGGLGVVVNVWSIVFNVCNVVNGATVDVARSNEVVMLRNRFFPIFVRFLCSFTQFKGCW